MKFEKKYPSLRPIQDSVVDPLGELICGITGGPCIICHEMTTFVDICFEGPVCSEECLHRLNKEWLEAERKAALRERKELNEEEKLESETGY